jgi:O-antigen/teichoic acid export membrane protein
MAKLYSHLPIIAIGWLFGSSAAGLYAWADRFTCVPSDLVATAVGDVYRQRATVEYHRSGRFDGLMRRTFAGITVIAVLPFVLGFLLAPALFDWVFGSVWREAGQLAQILLVASFFSFITAPVDKAVVIFERTNYALAWHFARLALTTAAIATVALMHLSLPTLVWLIVLVSIGLYGVDLLYNYYLARGGYDPIVRRGGLIDR